MNRAEEILSEFATKEIITRRDFVINGVSAVALFHPDLVDSEIIRFAVKALEDFRGHDISAENLILRALYNSDVKKLEDKAAAISDMLSGDTVIMVEGIEEFILINSRKWDKRAVAEPPTETVLKGPREGFIEDLKTNLSLLERRIKSPALAIEKMKIGRISNTSVALVYISTVVKPRMVNEIRKKLKKIDIDSLADSHYLQPLLENHPYSVFPQTGVTEKPDVVAAKIMEGRVAIIVDGSPMAITIPFLFIEDFQSSEDYYERNAFASFLRIMRYISIFVAVLLPGLYVSIQIYHYNIIPIKFLITLMNAVKGIPLSPLPELLFVLMLFEIIREASVRMPRAVGMAMSIVGALVLGDTAVKAGLISSPAVMITALSSIALYTVPNQVGTMSLMRLVFTLLGGLGGLLGIILGGLILFHYLATLDSFGTPYLAPFAPMVLSDYKDALTRRPLVELKTRPKSIPNINETRQG